MEFCKVHLNNQQSRLPIWLRKKWRMTNCVQEMKHLLNELDLHTVCQSAGCPNICECFEKKNATFLILGDVCTRRCRFCGVQKGEPLPVDPFESVRIAEAIHKMRLNHVVLTSVTRDDLPDGGAEQYCRIVHTIREKSPHVTIEVLIPDFFGEIKPLKRVLGSGIDVLNHNIETTPDLYMDIRPKADYERSLMILEKSRDFNPKIITKSGIMVGLGETFDQLRSVFQDLAQVGCQILTIGQYLSPGNHYYPVQQYIHPDLFDQYQQTALEAGIPLVFSGSYVRSSYRAEEWMQKQGAYD